MRKATIKKNIVPKKPTINRMKIIQIGTSTKTHKTNTIIPIIVA